MHADARFKQPKRMLAGCFLPPCTMKPVTAGRSSATLGSMWFPPDATSLPCCRQLTLVMWFARKLRTEESAECCMQWPGGERWLSSGNQQSPG
jgi:hypothetical protein